MAKSAYLSGSRDLCLLLGYPSPILSEDAAGPGGDHLIVIFAFLNSHSLTQV
jgi:hypothetical protein